MLKISVCLVDNEATGLARSLSPAHTSQPEAPAITMAHRGGAKLEHGQDELAEQRRKKQLTPAGRDLLEEIERMAASSEPLSEGILVRVNALPPSASSPAITDECRLLSPLSGPCYIPLSHAKCTLPWRGEVCEGRGLGFGPLFVPVFSDTLKPE